MENFHVSRLPPLVDSQPGPLVESRLPVCSVRPGRLCLEQLEVRLAPAGMISTIAGNGTHGFSGNGGPATAAELGLPEAVALDQNGNTYIADRGDNVVWEVNAVTGNISIFAGNGIAGFMGDVGAASAAELSNPYAVAVDSHNNVFISDSGNSVVRKVDAATQKISTVAGTAFTSGYSGDGGLATAASIGTSSGIAVDSSGNLYIGDDKHGVIRKVDAASQIISTYAGNGTLGHAGDGGLATAAELSGMTQIALDASQNLYICETDNIDVRKSMRQLASSAPLPATVPTAAPAMAGSRPPPGSVSPSASPWTRAATYSSPPQGLGRWSAKSTPPLTSSAPSPASTARQATTAITSPPLPRN